MINSVALLILFCVASAANAQMNPSATQAERQNIVTLSFNTAVVQTAEGQRGLGALQTKLAPRQAALNALNAEIVSLRKQLESEGEKLSDAERRSKTQSLETRQRQLQRDADDFKNDSQTESQEVFQRVAQKVYSFLQTYAQQHGFSVVIERGSESAPIVWYAAANLDITETLVKAYDAQSGVAPLTGRPTGLKTPLPDSPGKTQ